MAQKFKESPAGLTKEAFVDQYGSIYEHSPWVAERCWDAGLDGQHDDVQVLAASMAAVLAKATDDEKLQLIRAHPDLAGKAAKQGTLTSESTDEQASAGLDQCTESELERFQTLNDAYKAKFDFPFIMAVRGSNRHKILAGFEERLPNDYDTEVARALAEINKIALLRLEALADH